MMRVHADIADSGKLLTLAVGLAAVCIVILVLSNSIAAGSFKSVIMLGAGVVVFGIAGKTLSDWRNGVYLFLAWLLFEDLVRKYMGNSMYVYFGKDALIGITYIALLMARMRGEGSASFRPPFKFALGLFFLLGMAQFFNPVSPSFWYGLLGLKLYFYYIPLMFVGYGMMRTEGDLRRFLVVSMGLSAVVSLIGIIQAIAGLDFLNPHGGKDIDELSHLVRYTPSGLAVPRPPSVFVSDGRFGSYLFLVFILGLGAAGYLLLRKTSSGRRIVFPALGLVGVASVMSGSRGCVVYAFSSALVLSAAMLLGAPPKLGEGYRLVKAIRRSFIFVAIALALAAMAFPDVIAARWAFYRETILPDSPDSETAFRAWDYPVKNFLSVFNDRDWVTGHGIGTASLGAQYVSRILDAPLTGLATESGYGVLVLELGVLGPILWLLWTSSLILEAYKLVIKLKGTWAFPVGFSIVWFAFLLLFPLTWSGLDLYQNFITNAYLWLCIGILFRLPSLVDQTSAALQVSNAYIK
jgi:hypothetical protein